MTLTPLFICVHGEKFIKYHFFVMIGTCTSISSHKNVNKKHQNELKIKCKHLFIGKEMVLCSVFLLSGLAESVKNLKN